MGTKTASVAPASQPITDILARIAARDVTIGIMGLGYVGLPLALTAVRRGFRVLGFDTDAPRVAQLNSGQSIIHQIPSSDIRAAVDSGRFRASHDFSELSIPDAILIAVPTPLNKNREPDLIFVEKSTASIAAVLRPGQLVVLESTTWPGTTEEVVKPILETSGLVCGKDFYLAFSPEREDPGNTKFNTATIPKVVGADDDDSRKFASAIYGGLIDQVVPVSSAAAAEAVKITENIFRSVNIALVNELKVIYDEMGIDIWEVIDGASTKPFGYMPFYPGPGLGGHCIPIDPFYLTWRARQFEVPTRFIELAGEINSAMPRYVVDRLAKTLDEKSSRGLNGARILLIGAAYKKNVDDMRESPSLKLIELLEHRGATVEYHDTYIPELPRTRARPHMTGRRSVALTADAIKAYAAVLVATDHDNVEWKLIADNAAIIIDTRNVFARKGLQSANIFKA